MRCITSYSQLMADVLGGAMRTASEQLEEGHWLCPIEDRRRLDSAREGMLERFSLGNCLLLVGDTGRLFRDNKAVLSREVAEISRSQGCRAVPVASRFELPQ